MGLPGGSITIRARMKHDFNKKYMDYCRSKEIKEEIFMMILGADEYLEDHEERFQLSYTREIVSLILNHSSKFFLEGSWRICWKPSTCFLEEIYISYPMMASKWCSRLTLQCLGRRVGQVEAWLVPIPPQHPLIIR